LGFLHPKMGGPRGFGPEMLGQWWRKDGQQFYSFGSIIPQSMGQICRNGDDFSSLEGEVYLIQRKKTFTGHNKNRFDLLRMNMDSDQVTGRNAHSINAGMSVICAREQWLHKNPRKTRMFQPASSHKVGDAGVCDQFISIPPHTLSAWPVM
jgi:hypothetical protein